LKTGRDVTTARPGTKVRLRRCEDVRREATLMGRHAGLDGPARPDRPLRRGASDPFEPAEELGPAPTRLSLRARAFLALAVGLATLLVAAATGIPWRTAGVAGGGAAIVVILAAWLAGTMPTRPTP
jgi:hypothetical protein